MSLHVYLKQSVAIEKEPQGVSRKAIFVRQDGSTKEITRAEWDTLNPGREPVTCEVQPPANEVFAANITHNLGKMASEAGIYQALWRPEEIGAAKASDLVPTLTEGLGLLRGDRARFESFNPANGWGDYEGLVRFVAEYLAACIQFPDAEVEVSR